MTAEKSKWYLNYKSTVLHMMPMSSSSNETAIPLNINTVSICTALYPPKPYLFYVYTYIHVYVCLSVCTSSERTSFIILKQVYLLFTIIHFQTLQSGPILVGKRWCIARGRTNLRATKWLSTNTRKIKIWSLFLIHSISRFRWFSKCLIVSRLWPRDNTWDS